MTDFLNLKDKLFLITGASSGIGRATAVLLSSLGARIVLVARNPERLETAAGFCEGPCVRYSFDLKETGKIGALVDEIAREHGPLDGMVHCAGISVMRPLKNAGYDFINDVMLVNFYSFVELLRAYSKKNNNRGGSAVAVSSVAAKRGLAGQTAYCASKSALESAVRCAAVELSGKNIRVNAVTPGMVRTEMYEEYLNAAGCDAVEREYLSKQLLGLGEPADVANAIAYLLSDASGFVTGVTMPVDGGYLV